LFASAVLVPQAANAQTTESFVLEAATQFNNPQERVIAAGNDDVIQTQGFTLTYDLNTTEDLSLTELTVTFTQVSGDVGGLTVLEAPLQIDGTEYQAETITDTAITYTFNDLVIFPGEMKEFLLELSVQATVDQKEALAFFTTVKAANISASASGTGELLGAIHNVLTDETIAPYTGGYPVVDEPPTDDEPVDEEEPPVEEEPEQTPEDGVVLTQEGNVVTLTYVAPASCYRYRVSWGDRTRDYDLQRTRPCTDEWQTISVSNTYQKPGTYRINARFNREQLRERITIEAVDNDVKEGFTANDIRLIVAIPVDPNRRVADDEYVRYIVIMNGGGRPVTIDGCVGDCTEAEQLAVLAAAEYTGSLEDFEKKIINLRGRGQVRGAATTDLNVLVDEILDRTAALTQFVTNRSTGDVVRDRSGNPVTNPEPSLPSSGDPDRNSYGGFSSGAGSSQSAVQTRSSGGGIGSDWSGRGGVAATQTRFSQSELRSFDRENLTSLIERLAQQVAERQMEALQTRDSSGSGGGAGTERSQQQPQSNWFGGGAFTREIQKGAVIMTRERLRVRAEASDDAEVLTMAGRGVQGTVTEGPVEADGYTWWYVEYNDGSEGWSAGEWLQFVRLNPEASGLNTFPPLIITPAGGRAPLEVKVYARHATDDYADLEINSGADDDWDDIEGCESDGNRAWAQRCLVATFTYDEAGTYEITVRTDEIERTYREVRVVSGPDNTPSQTRTNDRSERLQAACERIIASGADTSRLSICGDTTDSADEDSAQTRSRTSGRTSPAFSSSSVSPSELRTMNRDEISSLIQDLISRVQARQ
jgi:hypothetical protein